MNNKVLHNGDHFTDLPLWRISRLRQAGTAQGTRPTSWVHPANYRKLLDIRWLVASNCAVMPLPHFIVKWAKVEWAPREDADLNHKQLGSMVAPSCVNTYHKAAGDKRKFLSYHNVPLSIR
jgi:hypothetical protein